MSFTSLARPSLERRKRRKEERQAKAQLLTFKACSEAYVAAHKTAWRNAKHSAQWLTNSGQLAAVKEGDKTVVLLWDLIAFFDQLPSYSNAPGKEDRATRAAVLRSRRGARLKRTEKAEPQPQVSTAQIFDQGSEYAQLP